jgi:hypothetical protein
LDSYVKKGDLFRLDLNSPEAYTIVNVLDKMYNKIGFSGNSSAFRDFEIDNEFMDTLHIIQDLHRMKSDAEVTRGNLADLTNKQYANMDGNQKGEFEKNIVKLIKAELATECLAVLPAAGKNVPERLKKLEGMMDMLRSVDECQPLKEAIQDSMKSNLKETLKSLSEKLKNKEFLKVIQKDMQMKNDANKKETTLHRDNSITNSKKNEHTMS